MAITGQQYALSAGEYAATIVEVGAGLRQFTFEGADVTVPYGTGDLPAKCDGGVLVPWPNRLRGGEYTFEGKHFQLPLTEPAKNNAIHGLGRWVRWTPLAIEASSVTLGIDIVPQTGWVFEVHVEVTYALDPRYGLSVTARAVNNGEWSAPFGAGFHPYLSTHGHPLDEVTLRVPATERIVTDEAQVPIGHRGLAHTPHDLRHGRQLHTTRFDDCFTGLDFEGPRGRVEVRTPTGGAELWFDRDFGYVQIFTLDELLAGTPGVAVEPMTCPADAFNSGEGVIVLAPGAEWSATWGITPLS